MIKSTEKTVRVSVLKPFERKLRRISEDAFSRLKKSLQESGYHQRIIATKDLRVIGGHQQIRALRELGIKQVPMLVPDKELTDEQFRRFAHTGGMANLLGCFSFPLVAPLIEAP
jgi:ParB-like chromosome segregation protein Spo0J